MPLVPWPQDSYISLFKNLHAALDLQVGDDDGRDGRDGRTDGQRTTTTDDGDGRTGRRTDGGGRRRTDAQDTTQHTTHKTQHTTQNTAQHNTTQHTTQHKLQNLILQYFHCLPLKTSTYEFHSIRKMISESRRIF